MFVFPLKVLDFLCFFISLYITEEDAIALVYEVFCMNYP